MHCQTFIQALLSTAVFPQKIQFLYCLLSSLSLWDIPTVDNEGKIFKIQVSRLLENAFLTLFLTAKP